VHSALSLLISGSLLTGIFCGWEGVFYAGCMDDFIIFKQTCWYLCNAIARMYEFWALSRFEVHPDKTQMWRMEHGFDWLGIWYIPEEPWIAPRAEDNHRARVMSKSGVGDCRRQRLMYRCVDMWPDG